MSWEHDIAREFKKRNNPASYAWFSGLVRSPRRTVDIYGEETFTGPLIIEAFDGQVIFREGQLRMLAHAPQVYAGQKVALIGDPFGKTAGSQAILVLGVI